MRDRWPLLVAVAASLGLAACGSAPAADTSEPEAADTSEPEAAATTATIWPTGLNVMGDGFPKPGDPCRRLGESEQTSNYLDDSAILVGCPGDAAAPATSALLAGTGARVVGAIENITLVSIATGDANAGMPRAAPATGAALNQGEQAE